jgi:hypothetical protein
MIKTTIDWDTSFFVTQEIADEAKKAWEVIMSGLTVCLYKKTQSFKGVLPLLDLVVKSKKSMVRKSLVYPVTKELIKAMEEEVGRVRAPDLSFLDLRGIDLSHTNMSGAYFCRANLTNAKFNFANLKSTHFTDADTSNASFKDAYTSNVIGLDAHL